MSALIRPIPLPDELDRSYLGRVLAINGMSEGKDGIAALQQCHPLADTSSAAPNLVELLSNVAGMSAEQFVRAHSLLPLRRAITTFYADIEHGSPKRQTLLQFGDNAMLRPGAYFCEDCTAQDISKYGVSYWRRSHQIIGQMWCSEHKAPLRFVSDSNAFSTSPMAAHKLSKPVPANLVVDAIKSPEVKRFLLIAKLLLERSKPLPAKYISFAIRNAANQMGFHTKGRLDTRPLLSDSIRQRFPRDWLMGCCDDLAQKAPGVPHQHLDDLVFRMGSTAPVGTYLIAAAALFDTAEHAMQAIANAPREYELVARAPKFDQLGVDLKGLRAAYVKEGGHLANIVRRLNLPHKQVEKILKSFGIPTLNKNISRGKDYQSAADSFFNMGRSLVESAAIGGLTIAEMESLVRSAGTNFAETLVALRKERDTSGKTGCAQVTRGDLNRRQSKNEAVVVPKGVVSPVQAHRGGHNAPKAAARRVVRRSYVLETSDQN